MKSIKGDTPLIATLKSPIKCCCRRDVVSRGEVVEAVAGVFKALKAGVQPEILAKVHRLKVRAKTTVLADCQYIMTFFFF